MDRDDRGAHVAGTCRVKEKRLIMNSIAMFQSVFPSVMFAMAFAGMPCATALKLYVAPNGNDAWSGQLAKPNFRRTDGPLATLEGARDALRKARRGGQAARPAHIIVADGRYEITRPLALLPEDGGTSQAPVRYEAAPGARPVFSGGRVITDFQPYKDGIWRAFVPDVASGKWYFEQLFVNGKRAVRARTPNKFWFKPVAVTEEAISPSAVPSAGKRLKEARQTIRMRPDDFTAVGKLSPEELKDVNLVVYH